MPCKGVASDEQGVLVSLKRSEVAYLVEQMLTDELRMRGGAGAATIVRKIVRDAIMAHKNETHALKARIAAGGIDRSRLMAGR